MPTLNGVKRHGQTRHKFEIALRDTTDEVDRLKRDRPFVIEQEYQTDWTRLGIGVEQNDPVAHTFNEFGLQPPDGVLRPPEPHPVTRTEARLEAVREEGTIPVDGLVQQSTDVRHLVTDGP